MPAPRIAIRNLDHLGLVAGLCQELDIARMIDAVLPALLHNSKAGQQSLRRRFRSVDLLSYRHT